jgi:hypothetical protein
MIRDMQKNMLSAIIETHLVLKNEKLKTWYQAIMQSCYQVIKKACSL